MSNVLKTGDVKRYQRSDFIWANEAHPWALIGVYDGYHKPHETVESRQRARHRKLREDRIARVLSIGPKLVTVRIEK